MQIMSNRSAPIAANELVAASEEVVSCDLGSGSALLDLRSSTYFSLNPVGAFVWQRVQEPVSVDALAVAVSEEFDIDAQRCRADVARLVESFQDAGLVWVAHADAA